MDTFNEKAITTANVVFQSITHHAFKEPIDERLRFFLQHVQDEILVVAEKVPEIFILAAICMASLPYGNLITIDENDLFLYTIKTNVLFKLEAFQRLGYLKFKYPISLDFDENDNLVEIIEY